MTLKNNRAPLPCYFKLCAPFHSHLWVQTGVTVRKHPIWVKINDFFSRVTLKFNRWHWKTIGHLFYAASSFVHHFVAIGNSNLNYSSETPNLGQNRRFFPMWPWNLTDDLENQNRAPLLCYFKLCASFRSHMWIQTGVTIWKQLNWVQWSMVITPENFMKIQWQKHSEKVVTHRQTDGRTERQTERGVLRAAWSQLKSVTDRQADRQTDRRTDRTILWAAWSQLKTGSPLQSNASQLPNTFSFFYIEHCDNPASLLASH